MSKASEAAKHRWAKFRYNKGKATSEDLQLLGLNEKSTPKTVEKIPQPEKPKLQEQPQNLGVQNSADFFKSDVNSFLSAVNETDEVSIEDFAEKEQTFEGSEKDNLRQFETVEPTEREKLRIKGSMLLFLIDTIFPNVISFAYKKIKKETLPTKNLKLDQDEKDELEPVANEVAEALGMGEMSPISELTISLVLIYASKIYLNENLKAV